MAIGRGELQGISYIAEATYGTTPGTPSMVELWHNTESLRPVRNPFESARSLGDRQIGDVRMGRKSGSGDIMSEFCYANFDTFMWALLGYDISSDWLTPFSQISAATISATASGQTIDDSGSGFGTVSAGDWIITAGFTNAANNGLWYVKTAAADSLDLVGIGGAALVDESAGATVTVDQAKVAQNGVTEQSFTIELRYTDLTRFHIYRGCVLNSGSLTVPPNGIVTMNWGILAKNYEETATTLDAAPDAATEYSPFDGLSGTYTEGGTANTLMTGITLNLNNNFTLTEALGSDEAGEAIPRKFRVDGNISFYKEDDTISAKFYNETETSLQFTLSDPDSNQYRITLPRVKYTGLEEGKGDDGPIISRMNFMAIRQGDAQQTILFEQI